MLTKLIHNTPEYKEIKAHIDVDLQAMCDNVIAFLKAEGKWLEKVGE